MKFITLILQKLKPTVMPSHLGRWRTEPCTLKMKITADIVVMMH